jgi:two-component system chemotaxis sensor kinase CheA
MHTNPTIDQELLESFVQDALEALEGFERMALCLDTPGYASALQELFRIAHNLKGAAMCIGLEVFVDFIHRIEDLLQLVVTADIAPPHGVASILVAASRRMTTWIQGVTQNPGATYPFEDILREIDSVAEEIAGQSACPTLPARGSALHRFTQAELDDIIKVYGWHSSAAKSGAFVEGPKPAGDVSDSLTESGDKKKRQRERGAYPSAQRSRTNTRMNETVRVSAHKLDELIQLINELAVKAVDPGPKGARLKAGERAVTRTVDAKADMIAEIHEKALELRMQPLAGLLQKLEKTAQALADSQGKVIKVIVEGGSVQLDKRIIEKLSVPLVHVIRNAVDHGIESQGVRAVLGKSREALIKIVAVRDSTGVSISVSDDGRGLNNDDILAAAVKKGLVSWGQELSPEKLKELIFVQGVSTATTLTEVSGRGVGLDVVMHTVRSLGGDITVTSESKRGTSITIVLPDGATPSVSQA